MKYLALPIIAIVMLMTLTPRVLKAPVFCHGYVRDATDSTAIDSASVDGITFSKLGGEFHQTTNGVGYYCESDTTLTPGLWRVTASHPNYYSQSQNVNLPTQNHVNFYLQPRP